jgi:hypothetical protein
MVSMLIRPSQRARIAAIRGARIRTGARAFSAHVQHVGALFDQLQGVNQGGLGRGVPPAVGKAVRRDVDDAHDERRLHEGLMGHATSTPEAAV